jgi:hypothetical protein
MGLLLPLTPVSSSILAQKAGDTFWFATISIGSGSKPRASQRRRNKVL